MAENVTIRILDSKSADFTLEDLDYLPEDLTLMKRLLSSPAGLFLLTGPTGSGKTTTLYACLQFLFNPGIKIMTAENPVEYVLPGITQVNVNPQIDLTYAKVLRSFLRHDPDVILIGEIRDEETAEVAIRAAETGHLVLSTLHTFDPISAILRLLDLGVSNEALASTLLGVIAQRLLKINCPNCTAQYKPTINEWQPFFNELPSDKYFYKGSGCEQCDFTGFQGRKPVYEMLYVDRQIQDMMRTTNDMGKIRELALTHGMKSMTENSISQSKIFCLAEQFRTEPYNIIEEFRTNPIINNRKDRSSGQELI